MMDRVQSVFTTWGPGAPQGTDASPSKTDADLMPKQHPLKVGDIEVEAREEFK